MLLIKVIKYLAKHRLQLLCDPFLIASSSYGGLQLKIPIGCIANMESGGHAFMNGLPSTTLLRLSVKG